jgi:hypothetical protein
MESARAATAVCSLPHAPRACPGRDFLLRKSGKPDLRWGRAGEGGRSYGASCIRQLLPPPPTPPQPAAGLPASGNIKVTNPGKPGWLGRGAHRACRNCPASNSTGPL